jgi:hypothetical protein
LKALEVLPLQQKPFGKVSMLNVDNQRLRSSRVVTQAPNGEPVMNDNDLGYTSIEVDERLLVFEPMIYKLLLAQHPVLEDVLNSGTARATLLRTQEMFGYSQRKTLPDGRLRLEPTEKYLRDVRKAK